MRIEYGLLCLVLVTAIGIGPAQAQDANNLPPVSGRPGPVFSLPTGIQKQIRDHLVSNGKTGDHYPIFSNDFYQLGTDRLLVFLGLPDAPGDIVNSFLPVLVEKTGTWRSGPLVAGAPTALLRESDGNLWLTTQWQVEGTYPDLYLGRDGLNWALITLPENRGVDCCFERLAEIRATPERFFLVFESDTTDLRRCWSVERADLTRVRPSWRETPHSTLPQVSPLLVPAGPGDWRRDEKTDPDNVMFRSASWPGTVAVPKKISIP